MISDSTNSKDTSCSDLLQEVTSPMPEFLSADVYVEWLSSSEPSHYVQFPEIIHYLTYTDEQTGKPVRLSHTSKMLYMMYRQIAGQSDIGKCWKSSEEIAEDVGISIRTLKTCRQELCQKFHQLDGNPLINLDKCQKTAYDPSSSRMKCKTFYYKIGIHNIWGYNRAFMNTRILSKKMGVVNKQGENFAPRSEAGGKICTVPQGGQGANFAPKQDSYNKNQMFKEQHSTPEAQSVAFSKDKRRVFPSDAHASVYNWLLYQLPEEDRPKESLAFKIATAHDPYDVEQSAAYITKKRVNHRKKNRGEFIFQKGFVAYLQDVIKNQYYKEKK